MKSKFIKRTFAIALATTVCIPFFSNTKAFAWNDETHKHIVKEGYASLEKSYTIKASIRMDILLAGAIAPDYESVDDGTPPKGLWQSHFYNYETGANLFNDPNNSAKTKFIHYANLALNNWKDRDVAVKYLGKACHFLGDINVPHHVSNQPALISSHQAFEKLIEENVGYSEFRIGDSNAYYVPVSRDSASFNNYLNTLVSNNARKAYELKGDASAFYNGKEAVGDIAMKAGITCVNNASHYTAAFLRAFLIQVNGI